MRKTRKQNASERNFAKFRVRGVMETLFKLASSDITLPTEKGVIMNAREHLMRDLMKDWDTQTPFALTRAGIKQGQK
jgi:hypothetical protein